MVKGEIGQINGVTVTVATEVEDRVAEKHSLMTIDEEIVKKWTELMLYGSTIVKWKLPTPKEIADMEFTVTKASWENIYMAIQHCERVLLLGRPGTGKTSTAVTKLREHGYSTYMMSLTEGDFSQSIFGRDKLVKGDMVFEPSAAMLAIKAANKGNRSALILNEINRASLEVLSALYPICDVGPGTEVMFPNGEIIKIGPNFRVVATMNGTMDELPEGLRGRFPIAFDVTESSPIVLVGLPPELQKLAKKASPADKGSGVRIWHAYHALCGKVGEEKAAELVWGEGASAVLDSIKVSRT